MLYTFYIYKFTLETFFSVNNNEQRKKHEKKLAHLNDCRYTYI